ncbi:hypothetical protein PBRA_002000 [Plasmodiophora brassicae]|uniref:Uncharacterized protein n=1 Tax=Plasmodiophora brassicae TaxID=37360 RepID=A0A0G4J213_PLABS|nr:hypothetical protein PBRA_002000 [Plasmodiophora brassicae]
MFVVSSKLHRRSTKRMTDREALEVARHQARARAAESARQLLQQFAAMPSDQHCTTQDLFDELMNMFDPALFNKEVSDCSVRLLWAVHLPNIRPPSPASVSPQSPSSPGQQTSDVKV